MNLILLCNRQKSCQPQKKFQLFPYIVILDNFVLFVEEIVFRRKKQPQKIRIRGRSLILSWEPNVCDVQPAGLLISQDRSYVLVIKKLPCCKILINLLKMTLLWYSASEHPRDRCTSYGDWPWKGDVLMDFFLIGVPPNGVNNLAWC